MKNQLFLCIVAAGLGALSFVVLAESADSDSMDMSSEKCYQGFLSQNLLYAKSGITLEDQGRVLLLDALDRPLHITYRGATERLLPATDALARREGVSGDVARLQHPRRLRQDRNGNLFVLDLSKREDNTLLTRLVQVDRNISPQGDELPLRRDDSSAMPLLIFDFVPFDQESALVAGIFRYAEKQASFALMYINAGEQHVYYESKWDVGEMAAGFNEIVYPYTHLNMSYLAGLGNRAYALLLDKRARISRVQLGSKEVQELVFFPGEFSDLPHLPDGFWGHSRRSMGPRQVYEYLKVVEASRMAMGVFTSGDNLFLLVKEPLQRNGDTAWALVQLDPENGKEIGERVELPTRAAHLVVVPGKRFWTLIEKEPVQPIGGHSAPYMKTASMTLMPTLWLTEQGRQRSERCDALFP